MATFTVPAARQYRDFCRGGKHAKVPEKQGLFASASRKTAQFEYLANRGANERIVSRERLPRSVAQIPPSMVPVLRVIRRVRRARHGHFEPGFRKARLYGGHHPDGGCGGHPPAHA